jgi:putative membrane protein
MDALSHASRAPSGAFASVRESRAAGVEGAGRREQRADVIARLKRMARNAAFAAACLALLGAPVAAQTSTSSPGGAMTKEPPTKNPATMGASSAMNATDRTFLTMAAQGGNAEVSLAKLALQKSSNTTVKAFAQRMVRDHTKANTQLAQIASSLGVAVPMTVSRKDAAMKARLSQLSGAAFDSAYLRGQVDAHQQQDALFRKEMSSGKNPALKQFAAATEPTIAAHLALAKRDLSQIAHGSGTSMSTSLHRM